MDIPDTEYLFHHHPSISHKLNFEPHPPPPFRARGFIKMKILQQQQHPSPPFNPLYPPLNSNFKKKAAPKLSSSSSSFGSESFAETEYHNSREFIYDKTHHPTKTTPTPPISPRIKFFNNKVLVSPDGRQKDLDDLKTVTEYLSNLDPDSSLHRIMSKHENLLHRVLGKYASFILFLGALVKPKMRLRLGYGCRGRGRKKVVGGDFSSEEEVKIVAGTFAFFARKHSTSSALCVSSWVAHHDCLGRLATEFEELVELFEEVAELMGRERVFRMGNHELVLRVKGGRDFVVGMIKSRMYE